MQCEKCHFSRDTGLINLWYVCERENERGDGGGGGEREREKDREASKTYVSWLKQLFAHYSPLPLCQHYTRPVQANFFPDVHLIQQQQCRIQSRWPQLF
jgi:hypothetical protein